MMKCTNEHHDCYGEKDCPQCFIRDNGPWPENPWLRQIITKVSENISDKEIMKNKNWKPVLVDWKRSK